MENGFLRKDPPYPNLGWQVFRAQFQQHLGHAVTLVQSPGAGEDKHAQPLGSFSCHLMEWGNSKGY